METRYTLEEVWDVLGDRCSSTNRIRSITVSSSA